MDTDNPQLVTFLQGIRSQFPSQLQPKIDDLAVYYKQKLWHQLTLTCEYLYSPEVSAKVPKNVLVSLYSEFIEKWSKKMNQLSFTKLAVKVAELLSNKEAIVLLDGLAERIKNENLTDSLPVSYILARIEVAQYYLADSENPENVTIARDHIDDCIEFVETMTVSPPTSVQASVYRISALYDKLSLNYSAFYRHTLLYLACSADEESCNSMSLERRQEIAHDLCISALLADDIFNFGELLEHSILTALKGTKFEFLVGLLNAFNSGDMNALASESNLQGHPALISHMAFLQEKLCLMNLAHFMFLQIKNDRRVHFSTISQATRVPLDQVEFLLIRAISCKIIRGVIDQCDASITVNWIQPRLLDQNQISDLHAAIRSWNEKVANTLKIAQEMREEGVFSDSISAIV